MEHFTHVAGCVAQPFMSIASLLEGEASPWNQQARQRVPKWCFPALVPVWKNKISKITAASNSISQVSSSSLLPLWGTLEEQQVVLTEAFSHYYTYGCRTQGIWDFMHPFREFSSLWQPSGSPECKLFWFSQTHSEGCLPGVEPYAWELPVGFRSLTPQGGFLWLW